ncbi:MAG: hypothetical protein OXE51_04030 [Gammaproteobacteria bacterium]|nr:hypothetical protein [Gammaproteobacteria bacterium]
MKKPALNNIERIFEEIKRHAERFSTECGVEPGVAVGAIMSIVNLMDHDRIYGLRSINKDIEKVIKEMKRSELMAEDS